jgi:hypothetical protein
VPGLLDGSVAFGGEESAGSSFLQRDGSVWTTDKDGIVLALLASEITAVTGQTPSHLYRGLTNRCGAPVYARVDTAATLDVKAALAKLSAEQVSATRSMALNLLSRSRMRNLNWSARSPRSMRKLRTRWRSRSRRGELRRPGCAHGESESPSRRIFCGMLLRRSPQNPCSGDLRW